MQFLFPLLLLLANSVSIGGESAIIQGDLQIYLPKSAEVNSVLIELVEQRGLPHMRTISQQHCSNSCALALPYTITEIDQSKHYQVKILILYQKNNKEKAYSSSFPVLTFNNPQNLNVVISIPPDLVDGDAS